MRASAAAAQLQIQIQISFKLYRNFSPWNERTVFGPFSRASLACGSFTAKTKLYAAAAAASLSRSCVVVALKNFPFFMLDADADATY